MIGRSHSPFQRVVGRLNRSVQNAIERMGFVQAWPDVSSSGIPHASFYAATGVGAGRVARMRKATPLPPPHHTVAVGPSQNFSPINPCGVHQNFSPCFL